MAERTTTLAQCRTPRHTGRCLEPASADASGSNPQMAGSLGCPAAGRNTRTIPAPSGELRALIPGQRAHVQWALERAAFVDGVIRSLPLATDARLVANSLASSEKLVVEAPARLHNGDRDPQEDPPGDQRQSRPSRKTHGCSPTKTNIFTLLRYLVKTSA